MRMKYALAATMAALVLTPAAAMASIDDVPPIDENDLPHHIEEPSVPAGPSEPSLPDEPNAVCTARVNVDGATLLGQLTNLKACPNKAGFNNAKLTMLQSGCNHAQDVIRLRYFVVSGGTSLRPVSGECLRDGAIVFSRDL
jgi:hypothetical protein